ncbi:MAG: NAD(P)-binding protein, partial [Ensifer adhaerens]
MTSSPTPHGKPDIVIIGSGIGGATVAAGLAGSGARIVILEAGDHLADRPENRDPRAIFQKGFFRPNENWYDDTGRPFNPGNYYNVGGNSKFYGAVLTRYRAEDFEEMQHLEGVSPAWPFPYEELEPWYSRAEGLFQVRGTLGEDPTEPYHSAPY